MRVFFVLMLLFLEAGPLAAEDNVFFDRNREGWFWYLELEVKPLEQEPQPDFLPPKLEEMRKEADQLLSRAMENPTEDHVRNYMVYQQLLVRRAEAFAKIWQRVLWEHPELDPTVEEPVVTAGLSVVQMEKTERMNKTLSQLAESGGLLYFFSGNCSLCDIQAPILAAFAESYGFRVIPISLDGSPDSRFGPAKRDRGAAKKLGVNQVPALFLARPPSEIRRVGTGFLTGEEIAVRLIRMEGEMKEAEDANQGQMVSRISDRMALMESTGPRRSPAAAR